MILRFVAVFFAAGFSFSAVANELIPVDHFARLPSMDGLVISPNGERLASILELEGEPLMVSWFTDGRDGMSGARYSGYRPNWYRWASNRHLLMSISFPYRRYGVETIERRLAVFDVETEDLENLVRIKKGNAKVGYDHFSQIQDDLVSILPNDDKHVLLAMDLEQPNYPGLRRYALKGNSSGSRVMRYKAGIQSWHADASGVVRFGWGYRRDSSGRDSSKVRMVFRTSDEEEFETILDYDTTDGTGEGFGFWGFTEDPNVVVISDNNEWGRKAFYLMDVRTSEIVDTLLSRRDYDGGRVHFAEGEDRVVAVDYVAEKREMIFFDDVEQGDYAGLARALPDKNITILGRDDSTTKIIAMGQSASSPPVYYYIDTVASVFMEMGHAYPELSQHELSETKPIKYITRDDETVHGYLTIPKGSEAENLPVIVHPHGGPASRDQLAYDYWVQFFVSRGWAVLQMNFRGSTGYGRKWKRMGRGEWGRAMQDDVTDGVLWAIDRGIADPARICIVGASYGGYAALQGLVDTPELYACGVSLNGVSDIGEMIDDSRHYTGYHRWTRYWRQDDMDAVSPYENAKQIQAPVMIAYGTKDRVVEPDQSTMMISALKRHDKEFNTVKLKDGDHYLSRSENRLKFFQAMDGFLQEHLGLGPVPATQALDEATSQ